MEVTTSVNAYKQGIICKILGCLALVAVATFIFFTNFMVIAPVNQFNTYRDGSEALVLGRILADIEGISIPDANLCFIGKDKLISRGADVLAVYARLEYRNAIMPSSLIDENWTHGVGNFEPVFLLPRAQTGVLGYASNELLPGQQIRFLNGDVREVTKIDLQEQFLRVYYSGEKLDGSLVGYPNKIEILDNSIRRNISWPYKSQYGIQGIIFSKLHNIFSNIDALHAINSLLFALTITALVLLYRKMISTCFAIIFFISMILSPWIVSFARDLYWIPFTWFLPAVFAGGYFLAKTDMGKGISLILVYLSFLMKCLAGYEFISSIILLAAAIFVYELFNPARTITKSQSIKNFFIVCLIGVAGFLTALLIHANMRGDTIIERVKSIYAFDVKRRTYGNPETFGIQDQASLASTPLEVIKIYLFDWHGDFLKKIPGVAFCLLTTLSVVLFRTNTMYVIKTEGGMLDYSLPF